jgi:hypothetical protein
MAYDSTEDTINHINNVQKKINVMVTRIMTCAAVHDVSKLEGIEKKVFDEVTPLLRGLTYGSDEYKAQLKHMGKALDHHYRNNRHHPEHHKNGIADMNLVDVCEMFCDWLAATERHADGDIFQSIEINSKRFNMPPMLASILKNTAREIFDKKEKTDE